MPNITRPYGFRKIRRILLHLEQGTTTSARDLEHALLLSGNFASGAKSASGITLNTLTTRGRRLLEIMRNEKHIIILKHFAARRGTPLTLANINKFALAYRAACAATHPQNLARRAARDTKN